MTHTEHELREFADNIYVGGYRAADIDDILFQWGETNEDPMIRENPITREEAERVCEFLAEIEEKELDETPEASE